MLPGPCCCFYLTPKKIAVTEFNPADGSADEKRPAMWANVGHGGWFAIPPHMAESFYKAGAEVRQAHELP